MNAILHRQPSRAETCGVCLLLATLLTSGCHQQPQQQDGAQTPPPEVGVVTIAAEAVPVTTELPGRIDAQRISEVRARVPGILLKQAYREGSDVKAGDVLFQIDPAPLRASYNSAQAAVAKSEANLKQWQAQVERYQVLVGIHAISKQEYDNTVSAVAQGNADIMTSKAALETASLNLGYATVTAPISGRIGKALVTEGALVGQNEATQLAVIQQLDPIYFDFTQSSIDVLRLRKQLENGQLKSIAPGAAKVTLLLEDGSVYPQPGKLLFSDVTVDPSTGMITLRAEFPNPDGWLLPGSFARGRLEQALNNEAITVSQRAVVHGADGGATVNVVTSDNKVEVRPIKAETAVGDKWIVTDGLKAGERVVVEGLQLAQAGVTVKPMPFVAATNRPVAARTNQ